MAALPHVHGYVRMRTKNPFVIWAAYRLGLVRLLVRTGTEPCPPECTPEFAYLSTRGSHLGKE